MGTSARNLQIASIYSCKLIDLQEAVKRFRLGSGLEQHLQAG